MRSTHPACSGSLQNRQFSCELLTCSGHPAGRVEQIELGGMHLMLHNERAVLDPPQPLTSAESGQQRLLGSGETQGGCSAPELV